MKKFQGSKEGNTMLTPQQQFGLAEKLVKNQRRDLTQVVKDFLTEQKVQYEFGKTKAGQRAEIRYILGFEFENLKTDGHKNTIIEDETFLEWAKSILQKTKREIEQTLSITRSYRSKLPGRDGGFGNNKALVEQFCQRSPINRTSTLIDSIQRDKPVTGLITNHGIETNGSKYITILLGEGFDGVKFYSRCYIDENDDSSPLAIELKIKRLNDSILGTVVPCRVVKAEKNIYKQGMRVVTKLMYHSSKHTDIY